jgi:hypothetical protein
MPGCASVSKTENSFEDQVNMQSGYAAPDHHGNCEKQRRLDRFSEIPVRDRNFGSTWQLPIRAYCSEEHRSAIAEADECHDVLS